MLMFHLLYEIYQLKGVKLLFFLIFLFHVNHANNYNFFSAQMYLVKGNNPASFYEGTLFAIGGRYDHLVQQLWEHDYVGYTC